MGKIVLTKTEINKFFKKEYTKLLSEAKRKADGTLDFKKINIKMIVRYCEEVRSTGFFQDIADLQNGKVQEELFDPKVFGFYELVLKYGYRKVRNYDYNPTSAQKRLCISKLKKDFNDRLKEEQRELTEQETELKIESLLKELRKSPGFVEIPILLNNKVLK